MKSLLEKLTINKDTETIHTFDNLLKAHIDARREAMKYDRSYLVLKSKDGDYIVTANNDEYKEGDSYDYTLNGEVIKCDVLEIVKK